MSYFAQLANKSINQTNLYGFEKYFTIFRDLYFRFKNNVEYLVNQGFSKTEEKSKGVLELNDIINETNIYRIFSSSHCKS